MNNSRVCITNDHTNLVPTLKCRPNSNLKSPACLYANAHYHRTNVERRYLGVNRPAGDSFVGFPVGVLIVVCIWIAVFVVNVPILLWCGLTSSADIVNCRVVPNDEDGQSFDSVQTAFISSSRSIDYFIPLIINWICYIGIVRKFRSSLLKVSAVFVQ